MNELTNRILSSDMARKKLQYEKMLGRRYASFLIPIPLLYCLYKICHPKSGANKLYFNNASSSVMISTLMNPDQTNPSLRQMFSPEIYRREQNLLERQFGYAVAEYMRENNSNYKPFLWT